MIIDRVCRVHRLSAMTYINVIWPWCCLSHDGDVIMGAMTSQITSLMIVYPTRSKKTLKLHVTGLCAGNSPFTGEFPAQRASNAENISIWLRHHEWKISIYNFLHCFAHTASITRNVACNSLIRATCATEVVTLITSGAASDDNSVKIIFPSMEKVHAMFLVVQWCDFRLAWSAQSLNSRLSNTTPVVELVQFFSRTLGRDVNETCFENVKGRSQLMREIQNI